jgi:hypothetical protein
MDPQVPFGFLSDDEPQVFSDSGVVSDKQMKLRAPYEVLFDDKMEPRAPSAVPSVPQRPSGVPYHGEPDRSSPLTTSRTASRSGAFDQYTWQNLPHSRRTKRCAHSSIII